LYHGGIYNGSASYATDAHYLNDSYQMSIMSYFDMVENTYINGSWVDIVSPMIADYAAMVALYGGGSYYTGNTTWGANSNVGGYLGTIFGYIFDGNTIDPAIYSGDQIGFTIVDSGGHDTLDLSTLTTNSNVNMLPGAASDIDGSIGNVVVGVATVLEDLLLGSGNDTAVGNDAANLISGNGGADSLSGGLGNDTLQGGPGNDTLDGGGDADLLAGGSGADGMDGGDGGDMFLVDGLDTVTDTGATGFDRAQVDGTAGVSLTLGGWSGVERVSGNTGNDTIDASGYTTAVILNGGGGNDTLVGNGQGAILLGGAGDDRLTGGAGNDTLQGATGSDTFDGGAGSDTFFIGETGDVVQDSGTTGYDRAMIDNAAGVSLALGGWSGVERIDGHTGNDTIDATGYATALTLTGGEGGDVLTGGAAGDALYGGEGNDTLNGGGGSDALNGGLGADVFEFGAGFGQDVIGDFENGTDLIDFSGHGGVSSTADLVITQDGDNTVITLAAGGTDRITLTDTLATAIDAADFIFP
jgi:serralysin